NDTARPRHGAKRTVLLPAAAAFLADLAQALDLRRAVSAGVVLEVRGDDPHGTEWRVDHGFDGGARHAWPLARRPGQRMAQHAADLEARQDQVAKATALSILRRQVDAVYEAAFVFRQRLHQHVRLVFAVAAGKAGELAGDFLQADHVGFEATQLGGNARRVDDAIDATAPLHVPADEAHDRAAKLKRVSALVRGRARRGCRVTGSRRLRARRGS